MNISRGSWRGIGLQFMRVLVALLNERFFRLARAFKYVYDFKLVSVIKATAHW